MNNNLSHARIGTITRLFHGSCGHGSRSSLPVRPHADERSRFHLRPRARTRDHMPTLLPSHRPFGQPHASRLGREYAFPTPHDRSFFERHVVNREHTDEPTESKPRTFVPGSVGSGASLRARGCPGPRQLAVSNRAVVARTLKQDCCRLIRENARR